jgi:hypothetical protein
MNVRPGVIVGTGPSLAVNVDGAVYASPWCPVSYTPALNDRVRVLLCAGEATILGATSIPGSGPGVAPAPTAPPVTGSGTLSMPAIDSGSYRSADGWGHPGSGRGMSLRAVGQGSAPGSSYAYNGAWFYGSQANQIAGATWDAVRLRVGPRLEIGSNNSALTMHAYAHTSSTRPGGDVTRVAGPYDFTLAAHYGGGWVGTLPSACYATIAAGGGISITGSPYLGIAGLDVDPASGQLDADWHR